MYQTLEKDAEKGISRMPLPLARLLDEDLPKQDDDFEMKSEEKSEEESKGSISSADKNKFIPLKDSASFFGDNLNHRQQAL